jgi:hypothetical protein
MKQDRKLMPLAEAAVVVVTEVAVAAVDLTAETTKNNINQYYLKPEASLAEAFSFNTIQSCDKSYSGFHACFLFHFL